MNANLADSTAATDDEQLEMVKSDYDILALTKTPEKMKRYGHLVCASNICNLLVEADRLMMRDLSLEEDEKENNRNYSNLERGKTSNWTMRYEELVAYKAKHGDCNVPNKYEANKSLYNWVNRIRQEFKNGKLSKERVTKLDEIGFVWEPRKQSDDVSWATNCDKLVAYKAKHGHCNVDSAGGANKSLYNWVNRIRQEFKNGKLSKERVTKLDGIGFVWEPMKQSGDVSWTTNCSVAWTTRYNELVAYKAKHGHCNVPSNYGTNQTLANWVSTQRTAYKTGKLSVERVRRLNEIGFVWKLKSWTHVGWTTRYNELVAYKAKHGHCNVPQKYDMNQSLGYWVHNQRTAYKTGKLSVERVRRLNEIGFDWKLYNWGHVGWTTRYNEQQGYWNVPQRYETNQSLGYWVHNQRTAYQTGKLSEKLAGLYSWSHVGWTTRYNEQQGYWNVPQRYETNQSLGYWVYNQHTGYKWQAIR